MSASAVSLRRVPGPSRRRLGTGVGIGIFLVIAYIVANHFLPAHLPVAVVVQGLIEGSLDALVAVGLVLIYRSQRIINFAQGQMGALGASAAIIAVTAYRVNFWLALLIGLAVSLAVGFLVDALVAWRFQNVPRLILTVATIGIAEILGAAAIVAPEPFHLSQLTDFATPLDWKFTISPLTFNGNDVLALIVVPVIIAGLWLFLTRTSTGIGIRAAADSSERAVLLGMPVRRLFRIAWVLAAALSGIGLMLEAPILGPNVGASVAGPSSLIVPLAAAVIGGMESLPITFFAALVIDVFQEAVFWSYPQSSWVTLGLFVFVLAGLLLQQWLIPARRSSRTDESGLGGFIALREVRPLPAAWARMREVRIGRKVLVGVMVVAALLIPLALNASNLTLLATVVIYAMVAISLVVLTGWAGQISLGQFAFVGVGAAATGALLVSQHLNLLLCLGVSIAVGAVVALLIGIPALRMSGLYLAVVTLAFASMVDQWLLSSTNFPVLDPSAVPRPTLFGRFDLNSTYVFYVLCLLLIIGAYYLARNLRRTRSARAILAVRDNPRAASAYAISPLREKLVAFAFAGALAGLAGGLYVVLLRGVGYAGFPASLSVDTFAMAVIGGLGSLPGAIVGAAFVEGLTYFAPGAWSLLGTGAGLLLILAFVPEGIGGLIFEARDRIVKWIARLHGLDQLSPDELAAAEIGPQIGNGQPAGATHRAALRLEALEAFESTGQAGGGGGTGSAAGDLQEAVAFCEGLDAGYGNVPVLFDVTLGIRQGEILALLGTNGAGKSTALRVISGLLPARSGVVVFAGHDITGWDPASRVAAGLVTVPGGRGVFPSLTVRENLRLAGWLQERIDARFLREATGRVLELFPALSGRLDARAGLLSGGEQQMLAVAQALLCRPKLLLIDELSLGLAPAVVAELLGVLRELSSMGMTVVVVEQSVNIATAIAKRAVFMERGRIRFSGPTPTLAQQPELLRSVFLRAATRAEQRHAGSSRPRATGTASPEPAGMGPAGTEPAGTEPAGMGPAGMGPGPGGSSSGGVPASPVDLLLGVAPASPRAPATPPPPAMARAAGMAPAIGYPATPPPPAMARGAGMAPAMGYPATPPDALNGSVVVPAFSCVGIGLNFGGIRALSDVNVSVQPGEILGIIGANGAGKTTLFDVCSGYLAPRSGRIYMSGRDVTRLSPSARARRGLGRVFQDARVFPSLTVSEALAVALERFVAVRDPVASALNLQAVRDSEALIQDRVEELLDEMGLVRWRSSFVSELSVGTRRVVELACVLAHEPKVLLLDEPSSGIAQRESEALGELLLGLKDQTGAACVVIEHDVPLVASIADRLVCLHLGAVIASGTTSEVLTNPAVIAAYLGTDEAAIIRSGASGSPGQQTEPVAAGEPAQ